MTKTLRLRSYQQEALDGACTISTMPDGNDEDVVTVPREALEALVDYAQSMKISVDQEFVCSSGEQKESDDEFKAVVDALGVEGLR